MAPTDNLSPAGSSTYSSNTLYVGDGTWDATRNDFLLPNLMGLNFETMRYNGMGNRFRDMPQYYSLILGHAVLAVIVFLFIVPAAILIARYYGRNPRLALRAHIYLQIMTILLATVIIILGFMAVGERRSLTNPHHGIGVAIYVMIVVQFLGGAWIHRREGKKGMPRKLPVKLVLHQWLGRAIALLGIAQVALGLTLYGSPQWTFILYAVWVFFLLVLLFVLSYRALPLIGDGHGRATSYGGSVIEERKTRKSGGTFGRLAAGAGVAALLGRNRSRSKSRARKSEVVSSRRHSGSGSFVAEEKDEYEERRKSGGGFTDKLLKGAAVFGAAGLAKSWYDRRQRRQDEEEYTSVANVTPSKRPARRHGDSEYSEDIHRMDSRTTGPILPGPGDPVLAAAAISAAEERPIAPRPIQRRDSYDSDDYSYYDSTLSPSRRTEKSSGPGKGIMAGLGLGWLAKKMNDRRQKKQMDRQDRLEQNRLEQERLARERLEQERLARKGSTPAHLTGDGFPKGRKHGRRGSRTQSSDLSSLIDNPQGIRPGSLPVPSALASTVPGASTGISQSQSRHDITNTVISMPDAPHDPQGVLHSESGSEAYNSAGGHPHRRPSERRRREGEAAAAIAAGAAASLAADEEARRHRSRSRHAEPSAISGVNSPPVSVKMQIHNDKDRRVTLRRLTEQEAAAERESKRSARRRRQDSVSSLSGTETAASRRRYRRGDASEVSAIGPSGMTAPAFPPPPPPLMEPLSPPNPAFAAGRRPKDSAYYSGRPGEPAPSGLGSVGSHGTWSAMSPSISGADNVDPAERRRRRRLERNNRPSTGTGTVEFS